MLTIPLGLYQIGSSMLVLYHIMFVVVLPLLHLTIKDVVTVCIPCSSDASENIQTVDAESRIFHPLDNGVLHC